MPIHSEDFEGGGFPTGWSVNTVATTTTLSGGLTPTSGTHAAHLNAANTSTYLQTWQTDDGNGGDVAVSCNFASADVSGQRVAFIVIGRSNGTNTMYAATWDSSSGTLALSKYLSGSQSTLAGGSIAAAFAAGTWYKLTLTCQGTTISATAQRLSDGHWLDSSGTFQSAAATAVSATDSSISGQGESGFGLASKAADSYADDWTLSAPAVPEDDGTLTATDGPDAAAIAGAVATPGALAATESADSPAIPGDVGTPGSLAATDGPDAGTIAGGLDAPAAASAAEAADAAALVGSAPHVGTLAATGSADTPAMAGDVPHAEGVLSAAGASDHAVLVGHVPSAILTHQEGPDLPLIAGDVASVATAAATDRADSPALFAAIRAGSMAATDRPDAAAMAGLAVAAAAIAATGHADAAALAVDVLPPTFIQATEAGDSAALVGVVPTPHYDVYANAGDGGPIDYTTPVGSTVATTWTTGTLAPGTHKFGVRAANRYGEEQNLDCVTYIIIDENGDDATRRPSPPVGLRAIPVKGARIRVEWGDPILSGPNAPTAFNVYIVSGATPVYGTPATTVQASEGLMGVYAVTLNGADATTYAVGVRAVNASGEEPNEDFVVVTADGSGPTAVLNLTGIAST